MKFTPTCSYSGISRSPSISSTCLRYFMFLIVTTITRDLVGVGGGTRNLVGAGGGMCIYSCSALLIFLKSIKPYEQLISRKFSAE